MKNREALYRELENLPEPVLSEVLDYVHYSKIKMTKSGVENAVASESSLKKDWLKPEEDEAWRDL